MPLLLVQGMGGHHAMWGEALLSALASDFDVVAVDHRGVGDSEEVAGEFGVADLAEDLERFIGVLGWDSAHVFGHSLGGMVAQELVLRDARRARSLVLASTSAGGAAGEPVAPGPLSMLQAMQTGDVETAVRASFAANVSAAYAADEQNYLAFKAAALSVPIRVPTIVAQARAAYFHDARERVAQITVPTLVLHSTDDAMIRYGNGKVLAASIPGARFHSFDGAGHLFWYSRLDETVGLVREHCAAAERAREEPV
jgi:pimeloyl-ACP methyl ester carboxylesterase